MATTAIHDVPFSQQRGEQPLFSGPPFLPEIIDHAIAPTTSSSANEEITIQRIEQIQSSAAVKITQMEQQLKQIEKEVKQNEAKLKELVEKLDHFCLKEFFVNLIRKIWEAIKFVFDLIARVFTLNYACWHHQAQTT